MSPASARPRPLESAFADHHAFVRERLRCLGVAASDLDDATQDVFEVLVRRIADYDRERPLRSWMAGIARRVARRYRDRGRRSVLPLDERIAIELSPEDRAAEAEARALLQRFLAELEPERWSVFVLSEIEGLRGSEIAAELGINQNTVYARLRSARTAFERTLQRQRARERRGLMLLVGWPSSWRRRFWFASLGSVTLGSTMVVAVGGASCSADQTTREQTHASAEPEPEASAPTIPAPGVAARPSDPASASARATTTSDSRDTEGWSGTGEGFSIDRNAAGQQYTLTIEDRYRFDGDRVIYERRYIGDPEVAIDSVDAELTFAGFARVDGELVWDFPVPAGETIVVTTTLRATREGVVELHVGNLRGSRDYEWIHEAGQLRPCKPLECDAPTASEEPLSGERIRVHVHNECEVVKEFVLFAGYPELRPPESVAIHSLQPDERRTMEIDAAQWFLHRHADGSISGGAQTDTDGASVTFSGSGDDCDAISAADPRLPPRG